MCVSCIPRCLLHVYHLRPEVSASRVSFKSRDVCFTCISCIPRCLLHMYQLSPEVSASRVSVAPRSVWFTFISCVSRCLLHVYQLRPKLSAACVFVVSRIVNRTPMSYVERCGYTKCPTIRGFLHTKLYCTSLYVHTYIIVEWFRQCTVVMSCYCLMLKPYKKINIFSGNMTGTLCS